MNIWCDFRTLCMIYWLKVDPIHMILEGDQTLLARILKRSSVPIFLFFKNEKIWVESNKFLWVLWKTWHNILQDRHWMIVLNWPFNYWKFSKVCILFQKYKSKCRKRWTSTNLQDLLAGGWWTRGMLWGIYLLYARISSISSVRNQSSI